MAKIWETIETKYLKKIAAKDDPHSFVNVRKGLTSKNILDVYNNMDLTGKGVYRDSE